MYGKQEKTGEGEGGSRIPNVDRKLEKWAKNYAKIYNCAKFCNRKSTKGGGGGLK